MRKMKQKDFGDIKGSEIDVIKWIILKNGWEIYVSEEEGDLIFGLTCGFEDELGYSSMEEIKPFIMAVSVGDDLDNLMPAPNWDWV